MSTAVEFNNDLLEEITINTVELCDAIADADKGLVTSTLSDYHVCELRGKKYQTWHELADDVGLDIKDFIECI